MFYAPRNSPKEQALLWHQLKTDVPLGQWIFLGEKHDQEPCQFFWSLPATTGPPREAWQLLATRSDLTDSSLLHQFLGTRFTGRTMHSHWMDQSRIDRFYMNDKAHWIFDILKLEHIQNQSLSDHDPILLTQQLAAPPGPSSIGKYTYFKVNLDILQLEGTLSSLQQAWEDHPIQSSNPTRKFALAWPCLWNQYKVTQDNVKESKDPLATLHKRLVQLKLDILEDSTLFWWEEFQTLRTQIWEVELTKANHFCSFSHMKWLGTADKPRKMFFILLQEKLQRESMPWLLLEDGTWIKEEDEILHEVGRFFNNLFLSIGDNNTIQETRPELLRYTIVRVIARVISKVHINGKFTEKIPVTKGVRQGFPLSHVSFLLTMQPLMDYLQHKLSTWELEGVKVADDLTLCHHLFSDNVGVFIPTTTQNFEKLRGILRLYNVASRAKLNLTKSIIIPLAMTNTHQWLIDTCCRINKPKEILKTWGPYWAAIESIRYVYLLLGLHKKTHFWVGQLSSIIHWQNSFDTTRAIEN